MISDKIVLESYVNHINSNFNRRYTNDRGMELKFFSGSYVATRATIKVKKFGIIPWKITIGHFYTRIDRDYTFIFEPGYGPLNEDLNLLIVEAIEFADNFLIEQDSKSESLKSIKLNEAEINLKEYFKNEL